MTITKELEYTFDGKPFIYPVNIDSFIKTLSMSDLLEKVGLLYKYYMTDEEKKEFEERYSIKTYEQLMDSNEQNPETIKMMKETIEHTEPDIISQIFEDDMLRLYEEEAREAFDEQQEENRRYEKSPTEYFGMHSSDFI